MYYFQKYNVCRPYTCNPHTLHDVWSYILIWRGQVKNDQFEVICHFLVITLVGSSMIPAFIFCKNFEKILNSRRDISIFVFFKTNFFKRKFFLKTPPTKILTKFLKFSQNLIFLMKNFFDIFYRVFLDCTNCLKCWSFYLPPSYM